jgi:hypothetical protein
MPALAAFPPIGLLLLAAIVLLLAYGIHFLGDLIGALLGGLPFIGGAVRDVIRGATDGVVNFARSQLDHQVDDVRDLIDMVTGAIQWAIQSALDGVTQLWAVTFEMTSRFSSGIVSLAHQVGRIVDDVASAVRNVATAFGRIAAVAFDVGRILSHVIPDAIADVYHRAQAFVRGVQSDLQHAIDQTVKAVRDGILAAVASQLDALTHALQRVQADLIHRIDAAIHGAQADLNALEGVIQGDLDGLTHDLQHALELIGPITAGMTIAGLIAAVQTVVRDIERCHDPMCSYLSPQLGALNAIEDVALIGALLAIVGEAINDPVAGARTARAAIDPMAAEAADLFASFTGIRVH